MCLTTVILAPGASEVGLGAAALAPLCVDNSLPRAAAPEFREVTFYAQASQTLQILTEKDVHFDPKSSQATLGSPRCPTGAQGSQRELKKTPRGAP